MTKSIDPWGHSPPGTRPNWKPTKNHRYFERIAKAIEENDESSLRDWLDRDPNSITLQDDFGQTLLWKAVELQRSGIVRLLIERGSDPNANALGQSVLISAIENNDQELVDLLLEHGANPIAPVFHGTAFHMACRSSREIALLFLLRSVDPNTRSPVDERATPLMEAAARGDIEVASLLLGHGADPSLREIYDNRTALEWAEAEGQTAFVDWFRDQIG